MADRAGRATDGIHRGRRLASPADLGHGHRQPGRHRRWPAGGVPRRARATTSSKRWTRARSARSTATSRSTVGVTAHRPYAGDDESSLDRVASRVRRREQRRPRRPVRDEGQRRRTGRAGERRPQQPADRSGGRLVRGGGRGSWHRELRARAGAAVVDLNLDGLLDIVVVNRRAPVTLWRNVGGGDAGGARSDGSLDRRPARAARAECRRHRRVGRGARRWADDRARGHRRWRAR